MPFHKHIHRLAALEEMFFKNTVWLSPQSICRGGGRGWEEGKKNKKKQSHLSDGYCFKQQRSGFISRAWEFQIAPVLRGCQRANEGEEAYRRRRRGVEPRRAVLLSSALTSFGNRDKSFGIYFIYFFFFPPLPTSLTPSPTQSHVRNNTAGAPGTLPCEQLSSVTPRVFTKTRDRRCRRYLKAGKS